MADEDDDAGGRTRSRTGARSEVVEVVTRGERRRIWTAEQKRLIVVEAMQPGASPAEVMRRWGISSGLFYDWRRQVMAGAFGPVPVPVPAPAFAQVEVAPAAPEAGRLPPAAPDPAHDRCCGQRRPARPAPARIEVVLPCGTLLRLDEAIGADAVRRVLAAVRAR